MLWIHEHHEMRMYLNPLSCLSVGHIQSNCLGKSYQIMFLYRQNGEHNTNPPVICTRTISSKTLFLCIWSCNIGTSYWWFSKTWYLLKTKTLDQMYWDAHFFFLLNAQTHSHNTNPSWPFTPMTTLKQRVPHLNYKTQKNNMQYCWDHFQRKH